MQLHVRHYGEGYPLIILHGLFGSLTNWHSLSTRFAQDFHVLAVDQRNHGSSPHTDDISYQLMADDLRELMRSEDLEQAHVLGHSMGGKTAMQFALMYPELVDRLIVVDIAPKAYPPHHDELLDAMCALDLSAAKTRSDLDHALAAQIDSQPVRQFLLTNVVRDSQGNFAWRINLDALRANYPAIVGGIEAERAFEGSTLFVRGEHSDYVKPQDEADIRRLFPAATIETVSGAGHWVHAEAPDAFARVVMEFLNQAN